LEFAELAVDFERYAKNIVEQISSNITFGYTLEDVENYNNTLTKLNADINNNISTKKTNYESLNEKATQLGVKNNKYTQLTPAILLKSKEAVEAAIIDRNNKYSVELNRQRTNDQLCKQFASLVEPLVAAITENKDNITQSKAELEDQLKFVKSKIATLNELEVKLQPIRDNFAKMESAGITSNRYTTFTAKDIEVQFEQYKIFLTKKAATLEEEIEHNRLRGVSQEQFNEIESTFKQFDADNSGYIDRKELKTCLYSLGEEKSRQEIDNIMKTYGSPDVNGIRYDNFREFMINILGVSDTKEDILQSFKLINRGEEQAKVETMDLVMKEDDLKYFQDTTTKNSNGSYDYTNWTNTIFSR